MINLISSNGSLLITNLGDCEYDLLINPSLLQFSLYKENTPTLELLGVGTLTSKLKGNIKLSSNPSNLITVDSTGLLVLPQSFVNTDQFVKVSSNDTTAAFLQNKLEASSSIGITKINSGGNEKLLFTYLGSSEFEVNIADSTSINLFGDGTLGNNLYGQVKISTTSDNTLTIDANGLYVPPTVLNTLNAIDTNSIDILLNGDDISANVKIDLINSNAITVGVNGLRVIPFTTPVINATTTSSIDFTGTSGMSLTANVKINNLITNAISISSDGLAVKINPALNNSITTSIDGLYSQIYVLPIATTSVLGGVKVDGTTITISGGVISAITGGTPLSTASGDVSGTVSGSNLPLTLAIVNFNTGTFGNSTNVPTFTVNAKGLITAASSTAIPIATTSVTGLLTSTDWNIFNGKISNITGLVVAGTNISITGSGTSVSPYIINGTASSYTLPTATDTILGGIRVGAGLTITSGLVSVSAIDLTSGVTGVLPIANGGTGSSTKVWVDLTTAQTIAGAKTFSDVATFSNGGFDSDMRLKTLIETAPIVVNIGTLKSKAYIKDGQFHIGYFAQEVEKIIPSAIITKADGYLSVAYHEVHTAKIEYLENRIQELENLLRKNNLI